jgi:hypothetical protein
MKKTFQQAGAALICAVMASCTNATTTTSSTDSTATMGNVAVTTTTTTTRRVYTGAFRPQDNMQYMDLKSHKQVRVRVDTTSGVLVNSETSEPMDLFVAGTDTIWGQTGGTANNYINHDDAGNYSVDQSRMNSGTTDMSNSSSTTDNTGAAKGTGDNINATANAAAGSNVEKYKQKANGNTKLKTADEKIKDKNGVEKIKER